MASKLDNDLYLATYIQLTNLGRTLNVDQFRELFDLVMEVLPEPEDAAAWILSH